MSAASPETRSPPVPSAEAEAARYALLRRLAPSFRHHLVVHLQPIGMVYEVMDRRLRAPQPDLASVQDGAQKISTLARAALGSTQDVVGWLAPDERVASTVEGVVRECTELLATSMGFRGFALRSHVGPLDGQVRRASLRCLLAAGLLHMTDTHPAPAEVHLHADASAEGVRVMLSVQATAGEQGFPSEVPYRAVGWADLQALAEAEGVTVQREAPASLVVMLPWMPAAPSA